jgi:hypothetical protein
MDNAKPETTTPAPADDKHRPSLGRLAAAVEAAYILDAVRR